MGRSVGVVSGTEASGGLGPATCHDGIDRLGDAVELAFTEVTRMGSDLRIIAAPLRRPKLKIGRSAIILSGAKVFTGLIQAVGRIAQIEKGEQDIRLRIETGKLPLAEVALGDSIATSGVCLTVTELPGDGYWADVSPETLSLTSLGTKSIGDPVNLEKSLTLSTPLGGHLVSGHVDGVGDRRLLRMRDSGA